MQHTYKGVRCLKSPIDIAIYMRILWDLKPSFILEIGSHSGGSALLLADFAEVMGLDANVISVDLSKPQGVQHPRVRFVEGDVCNLESVFEKEKLSLQPHPWFVTEDSAHTYEGCSLALSCFSQNLNPGDILAIEDGVLEDLGWSQKYHGGPNHAIHDFLKKHENLFEIATEYCDMFGTNATYNPNGYLRKI